MKFTSIRSLVYGLIICLIVWLMALIINQIYPISNLITACISLIGTILPTIVENLSQERISQHDRALIEEIKEIKGKIAQIETHVKSLDSQFNLNENAIISIQAIISCFDLNDLCDELNKVKMDLEIFKAQYAQYERRKHD